MATGQMLPFDEPVWEIERQIETLRQHATETGGGSMDEIRALERQRDETVQAVYAKLTPWQQVQVARHPDRPTTADYIRMMVEDFVEIHGDRRFGDDRAIIAGFGRMGPWRLMIVGHQKGRDTREKLRCNFGMAHPEGYRKALRAMKLAEKFHLPIVTLIDTAGAYPGVGAEERGEAAAIAENLFVMATLRVPIISVVTGEGCSGGAIGIGLADHVALMQFAYYSVISPEGCAAILWKTGEKAPEAATAMCLTTRDLSELGVIDSIIPEPPGGAHRLPEAAAATIKEHLLKALQTYRGLSADTLTDQRQEKYRHMGVFMENGRLVEQTKEALRREAEHAARRGSVKRAAAATRASS